MSVSSIITIKSGYSYVKDGDAKPSTFELKELACDISSAQQVEAWKKAEVRLLTLNIEKELYRPNHIYGEIQVNSNNAALSDVIIESMLEGTLDVWNTENGATKEIATGYLIHEVVPTVYSNGNEFIKVAFHAYSPDVMLTYDKYSMAHTAKRLCKDIIPDQMEGPLKDVFSMDRVQIDKLHNTVCKEKEIIMPYLVQYNESFYDFLRRVTYRSGEYMYYEGGKLHIGLTVPEKDDVKTISYVSRSGKGRHVSRITSRKITSHHHDLNDGKLEDPFADSVAYNEEYSQEDYAMLITKDPKAMSFHKKGSTYVSILSSVLSQSNYVDMLQTGITKYGIGVLKDLQSVRNSNKEFNEKHLFTEDKGKKAEKYDKEDKEATCYYPYLMYGSLSNIISQAYREIRDGEEQTESNRQMLMLDMTAYHHVTLGQVVALDKDTRKNADDSPYLYVVVKIERGENSDSKGAPGYYNIEVVPLHSALNESIFPPKQDIETVRYVGPQTAFVTSVKDAVGLGRVQVRFHWQTKDGDATPLIRLSSQMASNDAGVQFMPNENDEVIVNFTNGNIELPYVAGALFNRKNKAPGKTRTIRSSHGHTISFDDSGDDADFGKSILPIWGNLSSWGESIDNRQKNNAKEELDKAKEACKAAQDALKGKTTESCGKTVYADPDYNKYDVKCKKLEYRKEFAKKAAAVTLDTPVLTDDELLNSKYSAQNKKTPLALPQPCLTSRTASNKMYCLRDEIKAQEKDLQGKDDSAAGITERKETLKKMQTFYEAAMALSQDDALGNSEDEQMSKRYDICASQETDKEKLSYLPSETALNGRGGNNKIENLNKLIDDEESEMCEKFVKPDSNNSASEDYQKFVDAFEALVKAKETYDECNSDDDDDKPKYHTGGITLADDCGLYKLDLSASNRSITINSPMGTVKINAMTGITISAPNGDVKISGKNVSIEAGNNLTISAGGNIAKKAKFKKKEKSEIATDIVIDTLAEGVGFIPENIMDCVPKMPVDMDAVRCVQEAILKPVEGSLKIHTENNLMLESGGAKTTPDMSNMAHTYNQKQVGAQRSTMIAAAVKTINDVFAELTTLVTNASNYKTSEAAGKLKAYLDKASKNAYETFAFEGLKTKLGKTTTAEIMEKILKDAVTDAMKVYKLDDIYSPAAGGGPTLEKIKENAEKEFKINPGDNADLKSTFNACTTARAQKAELENLLGLINAYAALVSNLNFQKKGKELKKYSTWFLGKAVWHDKLSTKTYLKETYFSELGEWVSGLFPALDISTGELKIGDDTSTHVTSDFLKKKKREAFYEILKGMVQSNEGNKVLDAALVTFGLSSNNNMAYYSDNDGKVPALMTNPENNDVWNAFVDKFMEYSTDDSKVAEILNSVLSKAEDKFMDGLFSGTVSGVQGVITEYQSLATETQGNIYLTAKGKGTAKLKGTTLENADSMPSKFEDIIAALKQ